ncbi:hypothetical protein V6N11_019426 [Hibiscus sabdariffa]|uniref:RNase H type-1 domain-containing protein n=2 Tax=Hibiscus sabdariffa TaxID=183260 RepID=A0ABR2C0R2_9ROSI
MQQASIATSWSVARKNDQPARIPRRGVHWQHPPVGWHKLNTNGAVCVEFGLASCGGSTQGCGRLVLEVNSLDAVRFIREGQSGLCSLSLVNYIVELLSRMWKVHIEHVLSEGNKLADGMVKFVHNSNFLCHMFFDLSVRVVLLSNSDFIE